jgi:hypothetical protein
MQHVLYSGYRGSGLVARHAARRRPAALPLCRRARQLPLHERLRQHRMHAAARTNGPCSCEYHVLPAHMQPHGEQ